MGNADSIPVVSQVKSGVQLIGGDAEGAKRTQTNFVRECPGVSQVTSAGQLLIGDTDGAMETQRRCFSNMSNMVDAVPVAGHVKGVVHYAVNDREGGARAMNSANRTTGAVVGGVTGLVIGAPVGVVAGAIQGARIADDNSCSGCPGK